MAALTSIVLIVVLTIAAGVAHLPPVRKFVLDTGREQLLEQQLEFKQTAISKRLEQQFEFTQISASKHLERQFEFPQISV